MSLLPSRTMKKMKMGWGLYRLTQQYHRKYLRKLFLIHYTPLVKGYRPNRFWTTHLPVDVMTEFRIHLSWVRGADVTDWTDEQIGMKIVDTYHDDKVLPLFISEIRRRRR